MFDSESTATRDTKTIWRRIVQDSCAVAAPLERFGENQEAFYYQVMPPTGTPGMLMRATFYEGVAVTIGYLDFSPAAGGPSASGT